uniref:Uncharacterized protein n=1 Tax=Chromera velia CCMP2878 TaxID=1169474 RepID=A0A0G4HKW2_9ALVE|eukprot:Cvel_28619.t1-p1 / transcript=Cvel_28619.t1 / gene=Cvel_28619 / organism=Chromera_velia_CCMP2878 / gene_product=hypothetical protein / transcript_product=hypothetical protein / location=Cvel_scaffold3777:6900-8269(-) / protein_length=306 / sequence_SO=supercontig / SO=protein_coding / is_pseudo=false
MQNTQRRAPQSLWPRLDVPLVASSPHVNLHDLHLLAALSRPRGEFSPIGREEADLKDCLEAHICLRVLVRNTSHRSECRRAPPTLFSSNASAAQRPKPIPLNSSTASPPVFPNGGPKPAMPSPADAASSIFEKMSGYDGRRLSPTYRQKIAQQRLQLFLCPVFEREKLFLAYAGIRPYDRSLFYWKACGGSAQKGDCGPSGHAPFADPGRGPALLWVRSELRDAHGAVSEAVLQNDWWKRQLTPARGNPLESQPGRFVRIASAKYTPESWEALYVRLKKAEHGECGWGEFGEEIRRSPLSFLGGSL